MELLFDIGGTNTRISLSHETGSIEPPVIFPTPPKFIRGIEKIVHESRRMAGHTPITGAAGGLAGPLSADKRRIIASPALPDWAGKPFCQMLEKALCAPVYLENDTALVGLGEIHHDSGNTGYRIIAYMTVSTGIGACRYVDGHIDKSARGFEVGHHIVNLHTGETLEELGSGGGMRKKYDKIAEMITDTRAWSEVRHAVAVGIHNLILFWSPDAVIIGGGVAGDVHFDFSACTQEVSTLMKIFPDIPPLIKAELGSLGGLYGAKVLLSQKRLDPTF